MLEILKIYPRQQKILIISSFPPKLGGISVHVYRLYKIMQKENYQVQIFSLSVKSKFIGEKYIRLIFLLLVNNLSIVHVHSFELKLLIIVRLMQFLKKYRFYATDHNTRLFDDKKKLEKKFLHNIIENLDYLIVVGPGILENYRIEKVKAPQNTVIQNAFIPPILEEEKQILKSHNSQTLQFIEVHSPLLIASGFQIMFYKGADLYGLDMCIELTAVLINHYSNIGFLFVLGSEEYNHDYLNKMKNRINALKIENHFHFQTGQKQLWPLFKKADLMIRPTNTDGYGVSIAEALYFDCPAIASDVCQRPEGTIIFKSRNLKDLTNCTLSVLKHKTEI